MSSCKSCDSSTDSVDAPLPSNVLSTETIVIPVTTVVPSTTTIVETVTTTTPIVACTRSTTLVRDRLCSDIVDECHCGPVIPQPLAKMCTTLAFAMPACGLEVDVVFDKNIDGLLPGLELYAIDATQKTIRLVIAKLTPSNQASLRNPCSSCCVSTKPIGEVIPLGTCFTWGIPACCNTGASSSSSDDCLVGTFFFPAAGATSPAKVKNAFNFAVGGIYSLAGFLWKIAARVTVDQILLQNPIPGNGSIVGGSVEGGCTGECIYPITAVADVDECNDSAVLAVALSGCTSTGKKKLTGTDDCGLVTFNKTTGEFTVKPLLGGSVNTGPHYIEFNPANPCQSKLVFSPDLSGASCSTTNCAIYLSPLNSSNVYEVEVGDATKFSANAPNNIVTISNRQFAVTAIIVPGAPGKLRIQPRFLVTNSETISAQSKICVVAGCQPFPASDWPFGTTPEISGSKVYCSADGLRGLPDITSRASSIDFSNGGDLNISAIGNHAEPEITFTLANPYGARAAHVSGSIAIVYQLRLAVDGEWRLETLFNVDAVPTVAQPSMRPLSLDATFDVQVVTLFTVELLPAQIRIVRVIPQVRTVNASANAAVRFRGYTARIITHLMTT